jgi:hypothetical protein
MNGTTQPLAREPRWAIARNVLLAAIAVMSLLPQPWKGRLATFGPFHDCAHIAAFFLACLLTLRPGKPLRHAVLSGAALWLFGIALEACRPGSTKAVWKSPTSWMISRASPWVC